MTCNLLIDTLLRGSFFVLALALWVERTVILAILMPLQVVVWMGTRLVRVWVVLRSSLAVKRLLGVLGVLAGPSV